MSMRFPVFGAYTPKLPLRALPEVAPIEEVIPRLGIDCKEDTDWRRGTSSWLLEPVETLMLLVLEVELRVGVRDGSGSSPGRMNGLDCSCPFNEARLKLSAGLFKGSDRSRSESGIREELQSSCAVLTLAPRIRPYCTRCSRSLLSLEETPNTRLRGGSKADPVLPRFGRAPPDDGLSRPYCTKESTEIDFRRLCGGARDDAAFGDLALSKSS
jgi:hypothetical protein